MPVDCIAEYPQTRHACYENKFYGYVMFKLNSGLLLPYIHILNFDLCVTRISLVMFLLLLI